MFCGRLYGVFSRESERELRPRPGYPLFTLADINLRRKTLSPVKHLYQVVAYVQCGQIINATLVHNIRIEVYNITISDSLDLRG